jgi:hypothetical protein
MDIWTLTEAATFARLSYTRALRLVMTGVWRGRQMEGRWLVEAPSVREWKDQDALLYGGSLSTRSGLGRGYHDASLTL